VIEEVQSPQEQKREPLFPCYLFVKLDFQAVGLSKVQWTPGLRRVVCFGDHPAPLPDKVIELIRQHLKRLGATRDKSSHGFQPGETVRITKGPLQGMLAIFDGPTTPAQRVTVLLNMLCQASRAQIPASYLEKAPSGAELPAHKRPRYTRGQGRRIKRPS
jgi:transcriptional antiterminator RfaH